jgi:hypothetical protein
VTLEAAASDPDGSIAGVEFFRGRTSLGSATSSPYRVMVTLEAGTYTITAQATDNQNATATSEPVTFTVNPPAAEQPRLALPVRLPDGHFRITLLGTAGQTYAIETSATLLSWEPLQMVTVPAGASSVDFEDSSELPQRFYRARQP